MTTRIKTTIHEVSAAATLASPRPSLAAKKAISGGTSPSIPVRRARVRRGNSTSTANAPALTAAPPEPNFSCFLHADHIRACHLIVPRLPQRRAKCNKQVAQLQESDEQGQA